MPLIVVTRYLVPLEDEAIFYERSAEALAALRGQKGCIRGVIGRSMDDQQRWILTTEWESVGAYRRGLSAYDVKLRAVPVMYHAIDEPSAFEVLVDGADPLFVEYSSDRAAQADTSVLGRPAKR